MNTLPDPERDLLHIVKRALPEDQNDQEEVTDEGVIGVMATLAVVCGVIAAVIIGACIGGYLLFDKYKHLFGL